MDWSWDRWGKGLELGLEGLGVGLGLGLGLV